MTTDRTKLRTIRFVQAMDKGKWFAGFVVSKCTIQSDSHGNFENSVIKQVREDLRFELYDKVSIKLRNGYTETGQVFVSSSSRLIERPHPALP